MKSTFLHGHVIAVIAAGLLFTILFAPYALGYEIVGWGGDVSGQATPPDGNDFIAISAGWSHSLALKSDGSIVGWGDNAYGQATPPAGNDFTAVSAGQWYSLALKSDGSIIGWGYNDYGQATPPAGNDFNAIAASNDFSLALKSDGSIVAWGDNYSGRATPPAGNNFVAIAAGSNYGSALKSDGSIVGWGNNGSGQATPPAGNDFTAVATNGIHNLAIKSDGSIVGWGYNDYGECNVPAGNNFIAVAAGLYHSLAIKSDGTIVGWGYNIHGMATPPDGNGFIAVAAGAGHSLALREAGYHEPNTSPLTILITKCTVTAGSKVNSDKISFSGTMDATADDFNDANVIEVTVDSNDMVDPCIQTFPIDENSFKKGKYNYARTENASTTFFKFDTKTGKFSFTAKNVDLSGLACPLTVQIKIGDSIGTAEVGEDIVNGPKKPIPINLMMGVKDVLRVERPYDKFQVKYGNEPNSDKLSVKGAFAVKDVDVDMAVGNFVATLDTQTFTIPAGKFKEKGVRSTCSKAEVTEDGSIATAMFNFNTCSFTLTIKNTEIPAISGDVNFGIAFADFNEVVQVTLP